MTIQTVWIAKVAAKVAAKVCTGCIPYLKAEAVGATKATVGGVAGGVTKGFTAVSQSIKTAVVINRGVSAAKTVAQNLELAKGVTSELSTIVSAARNSAAEIGQVVEFDRAFAASTELAQLVGPGKGLEPVAIVTAVIEKATKIGSAAVRNGSGQGLEPLMAAAGAIENATKTASSAAYVRTGARRSIWPFS
jgi:hypothetical protein